MNSSTRVLAVPIEAQAALKEAPKPVVDSMRMNLHRQLEEARRKAHSLRTQLAAEEHKMQLISAQLQVLSQLAPTNQTV